MAKKIKVDFSGVDQEVKSGGRRSSHVPEGDYLGKVVTGELRKSERSGSRYFNWRIQVVSPKEFKGKTLYLNTSLKPDALWNLRNLIHACLGKNVAGKAVGFDPDTLVGKTFAFTAVDDEFDGKMRSQVEDVRPKEEIGDEDADDDETDDEDDVEDEEDEEDEEPAPKPKRKKKKKAPVEEDEEDEDLEDVDLDEI